jgi:peptidoglycan glycosyltransferase
MNGPVRHVALTIFGVFAVMIVMLTWIQAVDADRYREDPRNLRTVAARAGNERGVIISADDVVLAASVADPDDPRAFRRFYPEGSLYAHTVGYDSLLFGDTGLEDSRAAELSSNRDATLSGVMSAMFGDDLRPRGLRLTLNHALQSVAHEALGDQRGVVIALDPQTGEVLALVSKPDFDPNLLQGPEAAGYGDDLDAEPAQPLLNRGIRQTYPPGSAFKVITTAAGLETGLAGPGTLFPNPRQLTLPGSTATIRNFDRRACGPSETVSLEVAFARSCNTIFGALGMELGAGPLVDSAEGYGFGLEVPFELGGTASFIPSVEAFGDDLPAVAQSAIGQRDVRATPMQMALAASAVANGGQIMEPYLVSEVFASDGEVEWVAEPVVWRRATSPATAATLAQLMEQSVASGTGSRAAVPGVRIAGKTGTAEVPGSPPHAWFVGYGPVDPEPDERQIVVVVIVESGGNAGEDATGGRVAAPIAQQVLTTFFGV